MEKRLFKGTNLLKRSAKEVKNYRVYKKVTTIIMSLILVLLTLIYLVSLMYYRYGSFTISVNKFHNVEYGLSLSSTIDFKEPTSRLECRAVKDITNIDGRDLDNLNLGAIDGEDSGENYLCYTYYLKNVGKSIISYEAAIDIANMTLGVEKAVRVRVMSNVNGENFTSVDYARANSVDENGNAIPEPNTTPFVSKNMIMCNEISDFKPGDIAKYTVVIWLEGNDPDCIDEIIGGIFKIDMKYSVIGVSEI